MATDGSTKLSGLDLVLGFVLGGLLAAQAIVGLPQKQDWSVSPANVLLGTNVLAWGGALLLAYRAPDSARLLAGLAWLSQSSSRVGPFRQGPAWTLVWAVFFLFCGVLMLATGAGWL